VAPAGELAGADPLPAGGRGGRAAGTRPPDRSTLGEVHQAGLRLRRFFNPATGWFRRLERAANHLLSRSLYPRIPGIGLPYSRQVERGLIVSEGEVSLGSLPRAFAGLRILLVTDVHAGPFLPAPVLERTFERLLALRPDLVLLGGDLATSRVEEIRESAGAFRRLAAPLGVFAVLGNHDYYTGDAPAVRRLLEECGLRFLHNDAVEIRRGGDSLLLAGIDDLLQGAPCLDRALERHLPDRPTLLLSHNPDILPEAARRGVSLVLSGHTHGGQVRVPGLPVLVRQSRLRLDEGRFRAGETEMVVSRGLGAVGIPLRLACPPEAVLLTLRPAD
jgi:predicted MPP superfamily phosphohydrolase